MSLAGAKQLHATLPNLVLFSHDALGKTVTKEANNLPFLFWPDGSPCTQANLYMLTLRDSPGRGTAPLSRRGNKGGTIGDYAGKLSQLIRFCYIHRIKFLELSDSDFSKFVSQIRTQRNEKNISRKRKNSKTTNLTAQICLKFLKHLSTYYGNPNFVAPEGIINIQYRTSTRRLANGKIITTTSMYHHSFSVDSDQPITRSAISDKSIKALRDAADADDTSDFINARRHLYMSFLEYHGPRRGELSELTVSGITSLLNEKNPMLTLPTLKRGGHERQVSIHGVFLDQARDYIRYHRSSAIKKYTKSGKPDHDLLFISETTGKPLAETTLTNEINKLAHLAGIDEKACPHMFRHAFCENYFVEAYQRYKFNSIAEFELRLLTDEKLLTEMLMQTGHKSIEGILPYVKSAHKKILKIDETLSAFKVINYLQEFNFHMRQNLKKLKDGMSVEDYVEKTERFLNYQKDDIQRISKGL
jgi:integrase